MKNNRNLKLIKTIDGSHSIVNNINDEIYHSRFGAVQESQHIFINNGIKICKKNNIKILEITRNKSELFKKVKNQRNVVGIDIFYEKFSRKKILNDNKFRNKINKFLDVLNI